MIDVVLLAGRILLLVLVYLFLFAAVRTGLGLVSGAAPVDGTWRLGLIVAAGPPELRGVKLDLSEPITIGRDPESDLVIADSFVSNRHARIDPSERGPVLKDLESTNGTVVNGRRVKRPTTLSRGDSVRLGKVVLEVREL
jgi:hypothetical protein